MKNSLKDKIKLLILFSFVVFAVVIYLSNNKTFTNAQNNSQLVGKNKFEQGQCKEISRSQTELNQMIDNGRYLANIGVCAACHTPPDVPNTAPTDEKSIRAEQIFRTDPDWFNYLDPFGTSKRHMSGGVPFILRFGGKSGEDGMVYSKNITPDKETGIGNWCEDDVAKVLRTGIRKNGEKLFLFPPHSFYRNLTEYDARSIAVYLNTFPPVNNKILNRALPFPVEAKPESPTVMNSAPEGRSLQRARYLMSALVGCTECHSHHEKGNPLNKLNEFVGGDPIDPISAFRLGPDLPLRQADKGWATFPYPGYAVLYGGNLTRFGVGGDWSNVPLQDIVRAIREGVSTQTDKNGRPVPLAHVMMWQFYSSMSDDDAYSIAEFLKSLKYIKHDVPQGRLTYYGEDWEAAFERSFGQKPSSNDYKIFGKKKE